MSKYCLIVCRFPKEGVKVKNLEKRSMKIKKLKTFKSGKSGGTIKSKFFQPLFPGKQEHFPSTIEQYWKDRMQQSFMNIKCVWTKIGFKKDFQKWLCSPLYMHMLTCSVQLKGYVINSFSDACQIWKRWYINQIPYWSI